MALPEPEYRALIQKTFDRIEKALDGVDPDVAECEAQLGALSVTFADRSRCILSAQPSVRQLWLALAGLGRAYHFNWDAPTATWRDDKGEGVELLTYLSQFMSDKTGLPLKF